MNMLNSFFGPIVNPISQTIKGFISKRVDRWLSKRVPGNFKHTLSSRNIFIMPTRFGFAYLFFDVLLFLLGTNYQNNTILLLSYLLASLFITVMMHSFYNFSQLTFSSTAMQYTFANQQAFFPIQIKANKPHFDLNFLFAAQRQYSNSALAPHVKGDKKLRAKMLTQKAMSITVEQCDIEECQVSLPYLATKRGIVNLGRVKVYSEYSLGLFITWAMLDFSHQLVVFPQPKKLMNSQNYLSGLEGDDKQNQSNANNASSGTDDFTELKNYITGESQARVAWKQLARGQGKLSKHYENEEGSLRWLKLSDMPSLDIETKLSYLCYLIVEYSKSEQDFGMLLDVNSSGLANNTAIKIMPSSGYQHQQNCLIALAKYNPTGAN